METHRPRHGGYVGTTGLCGDHGAMWGLRGYIMWGTRGYVGTKGLCGETTLSRHRAQDNRVHLYRWPCQVEAKRRDFN